MDVSALLAHQRPVGETVVVTSSFFNFLVSVIIVPLRVTLGTVHAPSFNHRSSVRTCES